MARTKKSDPGKEFVDIWAEQVTSNRHLRLAVVGLGTALLLVLVALVRLANVEAPKPIVIRVDDIGRAEALAYDAVEAQADPLDPTTKYFLNQFLVDFYSRRPATVQTSWSRSLRFLQASLARATFDAESAAVAQVAAGFSDEELQVSNVVLRILPNPQPPHSAQADFDIVTLEQGQEASRERWTASIQFYFLEDAVPPDLLPYNPLGLVISYLQADRAQAF